VSLLERASFANAEWISILDALDEMVFLERENGVIARCNRAAGLGFQVSTNEVGGKPLLEVLGPGFTLEAMRAPSANVTTEGGARQFEVINHPLGADARARGWVHVIRDVTQRSRLEAIAAGVNVSEHLGFMASGLRHELGNPVNAAKMAATVLREDFATELTPDMKVYVDRIYDQLGRMEYLLKILRSYTMAEVVAVSPTDLLSVANDFLLLTRSDLARRGVELLVEKPEGARPRRVLADPRAMHLVLMNLVSNSADAIDTARPGRVVVRVTESRYGVCIEVADNGRGMSTTKLAELFRPFVTHKTTGSGLGLLIVKKLLSAMHATLEFQSTADVGTTARIVFPQKSRDRH
jgi:signal transduction histidine kinase